MSGSVVIRDPSVLLIGHGSSANANAAAFAHGVRLAASGRYAGAEIGFLKGEPSIATALRQLPEGDVLALPLALSDGHVARVLAPKALKAVDDPRWRVRLLPPAGTASVLPAIVRRRAIAAAEEAGVDPALSALLLIAHGGGAGESRGAAWRIAAELDGTTPFHTVGTAFLEESPSIADAAKRLGAPLVALGLFAERGDHVMRDVARGLERARARAGAPIVDAGPIGVSPGYYDAIEDVLSKI